MGISGSTKTMLTTLSPPSDVAGIIVEQKSKNFNCKLFGKTQKYIKKGLNLVGRFEAPFFSFFDPPFFLAPLGYFVSFVRVYIAKCRILSAFHLFILYFSQKRLRNFFFGLKIPFSFFSSACYNRGRKIARSASSRFFFEPVVQFAEIFRVPVKNIKFRFSHSFLLDLYGFLGLSQGFLSLPDFGFFLFSVTAVKL
jgi:hypothetical protein